MRWRRGKDPEPTNESDARFEDHTDRWAEELESSSVEPASVADTDHDTWDEPVEVPEPSTPAAELPAHPEVPVDLGRVDVEELARSMRRVVARALAEDLGPAGDITSIATVPPAATGTADLVAREDLVLAGVSAVSEVFRQLDPRVNVTEHAADGDAVVAGTVIATIVGPLRTVLTGERTALNLVGRLSGVATHVRQYVRAVEGTGVAVRDTRKTTPGLRLLEKAAVAAGGGSNHRLGLHDALLVKDNHILAAGSIREAARQALARSGGRHVQVEVTSIEEIDTVIEEGVVDILLDNFDLDGLRAAVSQVAGRAALEASGGVRLDTIAGIATTGVDRIAVGGLTHQAVWCDVALDVTDVEQRRLAMPSASVVEPEPPAEPETEEVTESTPDEDLSLDEDDVSPVDEDSTDDESGDLDSSLEADSSPIHEEDDTAEPGDVGAQGQNADNDGRERRRSQEPEPDGRDLLFGGLPAPANPSQVADQDPPSW